MRKKLMVIAMTMCMATGTAACSNNQSSATTKPAVESTSAAQTTTGEQTSTEVTTTAEESKNEETTSVKEETTANEETTSGKQSEGENVTEQLAEAIIKALGENSGFDVDINKDELFLVGLSELDHSKVNSIVVKQNAISSVNPDSLVIVDCKEGYTDTVLGYLKEVHAQNKSYQEQYPFAVEKVNGTRIYRQDNLLIYVIAGGYTPEEGVEAFVEAEYQKVDDAIKSILGTLPENLAE